MESMATPCHTPMGRIILLWSENGSGDTSERSLIVSSDALGVVILVTVVWPVMGWPPVGPRVGGLGEA
jgi:uncharacterized membrane protein